MVTYSISPCCLSRCVPAGLTFQRKNPAFVRQLLEEVFDGLYGYPWFSAVTATEAEDLVSGNLFFVAVNGHKSLRLAVMPKMAGSLSYETSVSIHVRQRRPRRKSSSST